MKKNAFWPLVDKGPYPSGCWEWLGYRLPGGYGKTKVKFPSGLERLSHRVAWVDRHGPVPEGMVLDHFACSNPGCVNPDHLRVVTQRENALRGEGIPSLNRSKTHCKWGHPLSGANLVYRVNGDRDCRECRRRLSLESYYRNKGKRKAAA